MLEAPDIETARLLLAVFCAEFQRKAPTTVTTLERGFDDATAILALPDPYRRRLRTTYSMEWPVTEDDHRRSPESTGAGVKHSSARIMMRILGA
jgi:hypothetical protein